jgi:hypothetical protein
MSNTKIRDFHIPFLQGLVVVGLVTIVSMISARYLIEYTLSPSSQSPIYTSQEFKSQPE